MTLLKALVPGIAQEMPLLEFERLIASCASMDQRFYEATYHPGEGRNSRHVLGERDIEGR